MNCSHICLAFDAVLEVNAWRIQASLPRARAERSDTTLFWTLGWPSKENDVFNAEHKSALKYLLDHLVGCYITSNLNHK